MQSGMACNKLDCIGQEPENLTNLVFSFFNLLHMLELPFYTNDGLQHRSSSAVSSSLSTCLSESSSTLQLNDYASLLDMLCDWQRDPECVEIVCEFAAIL